ncbi:MAG TPA: LptF/LptG family permease [Vicinamibacterales bacterium]|nr:LptF/LptG family permease [Vicinamibacterales bacterium]
MRTLDRYLIREIVPPFGLALLVFTFILMMDPIATMAETLLAKGVGPTTLLRALITLVPQALAVTIPMAFLVGLLVALGRLSGDSEWTALQACGVSTRTLLRPVLLLAAAAWAVSQWILIVGVPAGNQAFREIAFSVIAQRVESEVKPRVFYEDFPNLVLYARDVPANRPGWRDVFVADQSQPGPPTIFVARHGRMVLDRAKRTVELVLEDGAQHLAKADPAAPDAFEVNQFKTLVLRQDPDSVFPQSGPMKGEPEMTVAELRAEAARLEEAGRSSHNQVWFIQQKFSIPVACLVFALVGLGLGLSTGRGGKLAAFVVGMGVIFAYYIVMYTARAMVKGALLPPVLGPWIPNIVVGLLGLVALAARARLAQGMRIALPWWRGFRRTASSPGPPDTAASAGVPPGGRARREPDRTVVVVRMPQIRLPHPGLLDVYISRSYLRLLGLTVVSLLGLFYISTFIDLSDKLFKGQTNLPTLLTYFWFATPQFLYYVIPMAGLMSVLITIGLLTRNSELIVMRACGISLYRVAVPLLLFAGAASAVLFLLQDSVLAYSNRRGEELRHEIRTGTPRPATVLNRRWVVGETGDIYHYEFLEARRRELWGLSIYRVEPSEWRMVRLIFASRARYEAGSQPAGEARGRWQLEEGWVRDLAPNGETRSYERFARRAIRMEPPDYFGSEQPEADRMTYGELRRHIESMSAAGLNVVPLLVDLHSKLAFPFVTVVMTLIAVPFAVTTGRRGALYGIGVGMVLAMIYWTSTNLFIAVGSAGLLAPALAAWAPNLLFGAGAAYLLLTVRT